jgi:hypothetical protein
MDWRLHPQVEDQLVARYGAGLDLVTVAGGVKALVEEPDGPVASFLARHVDISRRLHSSRRVVLVNHTDCGAYGGQAAFATTGEEHERHAGHLREASRLLRARFPGLAVELLLAHVNPAGDAWKVTLEPVA